VRVRGRRFRSIGPSRPAGGRLGRDRGHAARLADAFRQHAVNGGWTFAGDAVPADLTFTISAFYLGLTLLIGFPFALMCATTGAAHRRTARAQADVPEGT
jgi:hypothetical protein